MIPGKRSRFDLLPLEELSLEELDRLAVAVKSRCLAEVPAKSASTMDQEILKQSEKTKMLKLLTRYQGPESAQMAQSLDELSLLQLKIAAKGGKPPNIGIFYYVAELMSRGEDPYDYFDIASEVILVFPDHYPPDTDTWSDPEDRERLGRTLVNRTVEFWNNVGSTKEAIQRAIKEEKTREQYVRSDARLCTPKEKRLHEALKRVNIGSALDRYESTY